MEDLAKQAMYKNIKNFFGKPIIYYPIRACKKSNLRNLISLGNQSFTGIFPSQKNLSVPSGHLNLVMCSYCRLVQLDRNFSLKKMYGKNW